MCAFISTLKSNLSAVNTFQPLALSTLKLMDFDRKIDSRKYGDEDLPTYPARTLGIHVATKGAQIGSLFGVLLATPAVAKFSKKPVCSAWRIAVPISTVLGTTVALSMLYKKEVSGVLTEEGVDDRAYRIFHNTNQRKVDRYSSIGAVSGMCSVLVWRRFGSTIATAATGVAAGVLIFAAEKALIANGVI